MHFTISHRGQQLDLDDLLALSEVDAKRLATALIGRISWAAREHDFEGVSSTEQTLTRLALHLQLNNHPAAASIVARTHRQLFIQRPRW